MRTNQKLDKCTVNLNTPFPTLLILFLDLIKNKHWHIKVLGMTFCYLRLVSFGQKSPLQISKLHSLPTYLLLEVRILNGAKQDDFIIYASKAH